MAALLRIERADGVTPFSGEVTFDSLEYWAVDARAH